MIKTIDKLCLGCGIVFVASLKEHNRGNAKYCSLLCANQHTGRNRVKPHISNTTCSTCGTPIYKRPNILTKSKTGHFFCNRICKELAQRVGTPLSIPEIQPDKYGTGHTFYRARAIRAYGCRCQKCGYDAYSVLIQVHHLDRDRANSALENLQVLCIRCHMEEHFDAGDGPFAKNIKIYVDIESIST